LWQSVWPALCATALMALAVKSLQAHAPAGGPALGLLRDVCAGAVVYLGSAGILWHLRGRPDGIEREIFARMSKLAIRWIGRRQHSQ
jgi:hypothetical protein